MAGVYYIDAGAINVCPPRLADSPTVDFQWKYGVCCFCFTTIKWRATMKSPHFLTPQHCSESPPVMCLLRDMSSYNGDLAVYFCNVDFIWTALLMLMSIPNQNVDFNFNPLNFDLIWINFLLFFSHYSITVIVMLCSMCCCTIKAQSDDDADDCLCTDAYDL